jgi:hypothetical protein
MRKKNWVGGYVRMTQNMEKERIIELGEFINKSLFDGSAKTNPAFDESVTLFTQHAITMLKEQEEKMEHLNNITLEYEKEVFRLKTLLKEQENEYEKGFNDAMHGKQELMYEGIDGKWHKKDW